MASRVTGRLVAALLLTLLTTGLTACGPEDEAAPRSQPTPYAPTTSQQPADDHPTAPAAKPVPLRPGEHRMTLTMPETYTPSAPTGVGTDDYRCFLLNPHLTKDVYLTGTFVQPDNANVVHHVILFDVPPDTVKKAEALDRSTPGEGWTCFGNSGISDQPGAGLDDAPWLGAWAPGGKESVTAPGYGKKLVAGSRIVMQIHYNLLAGPGPDRSSTLLRVNDSGRQLTPLETVLLPAPVELPCRPQYSDGPLCNRTASMQDVIKRFGNPGYTNNLLYYLCGGKPHPSEITHCDRTVNTTETVRAVAGHMHLLGRWIKITVNPGTPRAHTLLDIPVWNFDDQGSKPIKPYTLHPGDVVRTTCKHVQWLRDKLPAFKGIPDKYVVWGEGTTDEMCLGILTVTRP